MNTTTLERCANCDRQIGKLETPYLWNEKVVCAECKRQLNKAEAPVRAEAVDDTDVIGAIHQEVGAGTIDYAREEAKRFAATGGATARSKYAPNKKSRGIHRTLGGALAIIGIVVTAVGWKYFDSEGIRVGTSPAWSVPAMFVGLVVFCVGMLWFAVGRVVGRR
jgi:hypothetical protein